MASGDDDIGDDDASPIGPPPPLADRTWRHPAEIAIAARRDRRRRRNRRWAGVALGSAVSGGILASMTLGGDASSPSPRAPVAAAAAATTTPTEADRQADWAHDVTVAARAATVSVRSDTGTVPIAHAVALGHDGFIVTSGRALGDHTTFIVSAQDGSTHRAELLGHDPDTDVAVLVIGTTLPAAPTADDAPTTGDQVAVVEGTDTARADTVAYDTVIAETDAGDALIGLFSLTGSKYETLAGSPIVDGDGAVIGITAHTSERHAAAAVPIGVASRVADEIIESGRAAHAWLGVSLVDVGPAVVTAVASDSPAAMAGIEVDDLIKAVDDQPVDDAAALVGALLALEPGHRVEIAVDRQGEALTLWFELGARQAD